MRGFWLLNVLIFSALTTAVHGQNCQPQNDSAVLVDFYGATKGLNWKVKWDLNKPFKRWSGVSVNQSGCVTGIELSDNGLQGNIIDFDLPFLETLDVSDNNILSMVPALSKVPALKHLNLSGNRFRGPLPALANSDQMETIQANANQLDGQIPDYSAMTELRILNLSNNKLTGGIEVISNFRKLSHLNLGQNAFQGSIPVLNDKSQLEVIDLSNNMLSGNLPVLDSLTKLTRANLAENKLSGTFQWPVNVPELEVLNISDNMLTDTIPPTGPVGKLIQFLASSNQFSGQIPDLELPVLKDLMLSQNQFTGSIPLFSGLPALEQFSLRHNELENIDFQPDFLNQIVYADVSENRMTFQDLVPFRNYRGGTIALFPQKKISFKTSSFTVTKGNNYTIELDTDEDHGSTDFQWFKNGMRLSVGTGRNFFISNIIPRDAGEYTVTMTNSRFAGFPITSEVFTLVVNCPQVIAERKIYLCPGEEFVYKGETYLRDTMFADTVYSQSEFVCDSLYLFDIENYHPDSVHAVSEICEGEIYYFGPDSTELIRSGIYLDTFPNIGGCDSIVLLELSFRDKYEQTIDVGICPGDSLVYKDSVYYEDVVLVDSFTSVYGCDSLIIREVRFSDPVRTTTRYDICEGDSIMVDGQYYSDFATWSDTLVAKGGCDSISTIEIAVREKYEETLDIRLCSPETYTWQGRPLSTSGQYSDTLQTSYGCDSIIHLNLMVFPSYFVRDTQYLCQGDSALFNGTWLTGSGVYFSDKNTVQGCDSMNVLVLEFRDYAEKWVSTEICQGDTLFYNDKSYTHSGVYTDTVGSEASCDTLVTIEVVITELVLADSIITGSGSADSSGSIAVEISGGTGPYQYMWSTGDTTATVDSLKAGDYMLTVTDSLGCSATFDLSVPVMTFVRNQVEKKNWIQIRPNYIDRGSRSSVNLDVRESMKQIRISLYNELGQEIEHRQVDQLQSGESLNWELGLYPAGLYYFHIREEGLNPFQVERLVIF